MREAKFSTSYAESSHITKTKGWQELMEKYFPDEDLAKVHKEGLKATKKQFRNNNETGETEIIAEEPDFPTRHKYLETAYKVKGKQGEDTPTPQPQLHLHVHKHEEIKSKYEKELEEAFKDDESTT